MFMPSLSAHKETSRPIDQLCGAKISPDTGNLSPQYPGNDHLNYGAVAREISRDAIEFCDMLNEQVAAASPLRKIQVNQALQMTQHALGSEFQGAQFHNLSMHSILDSFIS